MKTRKLLIFLCFISTFCFGQVTINDFTGNENRTHMVRKLDTLPGLTVETVSVTKPRKLLFKTLRHEKLIVKDLINTDNKVILKGKSKFIKSMDATKTVRFARIKIRDNKIFKYKESSLIKRGTIIEYDLSGKQLKKKRIDKEKVVFEYTRE